MNYTEQQCCDADDSVVTSARALDAVVDLEATWTGDDDTGPSEPNVAAGRDLALACIRGLSAVPINDLLAEVERRGFARPVPASTVPVAWNDGGDDARQDTP